MKNEKLFELLRKIALIALLLLLVGFEFAFRAFNDTFCMSEDFYMTATRVIGGFACIVFMLEFSFGKVFSLIGNKKWIWYLAILPAFVIAVNNFPFVSYLSGDCSFSAEAGELLLFALSCLCVGFFEEMAFRGCALMYIMKKRSGTRLGIFLSIVLSSCVFGLVHLVNIFTSSPGAVIRQIGYSALIGAMCSIVLIATRNIWLCVICHGVYNFCGGIIDKFGNGNMWTVPQIICTATVAVIVAAYMVWIFFKLPIDNAKELYREQKKVEQ